MQGLLPADWARRAGAVAVLGVRLLTLADVTEILAGLERPTRWWHELYDGLASGHLGAVERDALGALPVPLADGRLVVGPRGLLLPSAEVPVEPLIALGLRAVDPGAAHPLLTLLEAIEATPRTVLDDPAVRAAVASSYDEDNAPGLADAVLALVAAAGLRAGELPWLADLALPGADGETYPAGELLLPGSPLVGLVSGDAPFGVAADSLVERWGADVLGAAGVLATFALVRESDAVGTVHDLDDEDGWWATFPPGSSVPDLVAVRDLELVDPARWQAALALLAEPPLRDAVVAPTLLDVGGPRLAVPSYTAWWLSWQPVLDGRRPRELMAGGLSGLYDVAPEVLDDVFLRAIGVWSGIADVVADIDGVADLLARLGDEARTVDRALVTVVHAAIAASPVAREVPPPERMRGIHADAVVVVEAADSVVVDAPDLLPLIGGRAVVPVPLPLAADLADIFALPLASELPAYAVVSDGRADGDHMVHDELLVADIDGKPQRVAWRYVDGVLHVDAGRLAFGLGRGRAWVQGAWWRRHLVTALLADPSDAAELQAEADLD